jgi:cytochrome c biogenesis factor
MWHGRGWVMNDPIVLFMGAIGCAYIASVQVRDFIRHYPESRWACLIDAFALIGWTTVAVQLAIAAFS